MPLCTWHLALSTWNLAQARKGRGWPGFANVRTYLAVAFVVPPTDALCCHKLGAGLIAVKWAVVFAFVSRASLAAAWAGMLQVGRGQGQGLTGTGRPIPYTELHVLTNQAYSPC